MKKYNISFYVSGKASRLRKILQSCDDSVKNSIRLVVCDNLNNLDLTEELAKYNIRFICIDYNELHEEKRMRALVLSDLLNERFQEFEIDYCFCFGNQLLKGNLLTLYRNRIINFHPSVLPHFPGRLSIDKALAAKVFLLGNTAHFIDDGIDTGPVIMQNVVSYKFFQEFGYEGVLDQQIKMFIQIFTWLKKGRIVVNNDEVTIFDADYGESVFFPKLN